MPDNVSLTEFVSQAQRGLYSRVFGPEYLMKQSYFTVDTATGIFNTTYGKKVWHALNNQVRFFNAIPRVVWGNTAGWRIRTDRGTGRSRPVTETGTLPTVDISNIATVSSLPKIVSTTFGASVKSIFTANLEGGVGDVLAMEQENSQLDHVKEINEELLAGSMYLISTGDGTTFTVPASIAHHYKIGDRITKWDTSDNAWENTTGLTVSGVNPTTGVVTTGAATDNYADGDLIAIYSRAGFTSIDDVVAEDGMMVGGGDGDAAFATDGGVRAYDLTYADRVAGTWNAGGRVSTNSGVGRDLTLQLLDNSIRDVRVNGGEPKLILCGWDQYFRLQRLLNANQRFMGQEEYQVGVGNEKTLPGTRTGFVVATYQGIPVLADADVPVSVATNDALLGSNMYILDTDYLEIAIAQPTQYVENRDYFAVNALVVRGLLYTMGELRCTGFNRQAVIRDLNI